MQLLSTSYESVVLAISPDRRVFAFSALAAVASTAAFTLAPIARASRIDPGPILEAIGRHTVGVRRARLARALMVVQVAISLTLLAGSALFVRNLRGILATDIGFNRENLLVVTVDSLSPVSARGRGRADATVTSYYSELLRRLRDTPGVRSAILSSKPPISNEEGLWWARIAAEGAPQPACGSDQIARAHCLTAARVRTQFCNTRY